MSLWTRLTDLKVLAEFEREEVPLESAKNTASSQMEEIREWFFSEPTGIHEVAEDANAAEVAKAEKRVELLEATNKVLNEKDWAAFTPESEQTLVAELQFLRALDKHDLWHKATDSWVTGLLPKGALIHFKASNEYAFVLKPHNCAALCWPAEQTKIGLWRKDPAATSLIWRTIFSMDDVDVMLTEYASPLHLFVEDAHRR